MDKYIFEAEKEQYKPEEVEVQFKKAYSDRQTFTHYFSRDRIKKMSIDEYVQGKGMKSLQNFCYAIEWGLADFGKIQGSSCLKFGVYYSHNEKAYVFAKKYGRTVEEAFETVRGAILSLLDAGERHDIDAIAKNILSPMFKGKILSLYYPERYLNIFSEEHINYYITELGCDVHGCSDFDVARKRELLIEFKNKDEKMKNWSLHAFSRFLYDVYPKAPNKYKQEHEGIMHPLSKVLLYDCNFTFQPKLLTHTKFENKKIDFEKLQREAKRVGNRGERLVLEYEKTWLQEIGIRKEPVAIAEDGDGTGYDILSYFADGSEKYIEVKATKNKMGGDSFFISLNEYRRALELKESYCIYFVLEAFSSQPKIVNLGNPFIETVKEADMTPITYRIDVKFSKD